MFSNWSLTRRATVEALVIFGTATVLLGYFIYIEAFEYVVAVSHRHENWELDEILVTLMVLPIAVGIFAWRRLRDAWQELSRRETAERQAKAMALHDPLTGLPNRRKVSEELAHALATADTRAIAVLMIDLNRFKATNDLYGHRAGDELLLEVGQRLVRSSGKDALVARLGGDEFVVLIHDAPPSDALVSRVQEISEAFDDPFRLECASIASGAAIGVTVIDTAGVSPDTALAHADAAMYRSKRAGGNAYCFFERGMEKAAKRRAETEAGLRTAIAEGRIEPFYQPLVRLTDGEVLGFEALARWRVSDGNVREPDEFIGIAEESGLISDLFFSVLKQSVEQARKWPPHWRLAVNLSPRQFEDEWLVERILRTLAEHGFAPGRLDVEITETALVADLANARKLIERLKLQGIHVALDDFGTGYSSLRHLSELSFDKLKIDRSFTRDLSTSHSSQTIVRTITSMAHHLGLEVTVEGVETPDSARTLAEFGCDVGQGYLYGPPTPETEVARAEAQATLAQEARPWKKRGPAAA